mmetsp:Transcript_15777/g.45246  ORF Transcript_15777/g.45246 Transcript_15777/m.45246 type:complete len:245 (+) Transcript_15777:322-1056(+)
MVFLRPEDRVGDRGRPAVDRRRANGGGEGGGAEGTAQRPVDRDGPHGDVRGGDRQAAAGQAGGPKGSPEDTAGARVPQHRAWRERHRLAQAAADAGGGSSGARVRNGEEDGGAHRGVRCDQADGRGPPHGGRAGAADTSRGAHQGELERGLLRVPHLHRRGRRPGEALERLPLLPRRPRGLHRRAPQVSAARAGSGDVPHLPGAVLHLRHHDCSSEGRRRPRLGSDEHGEGPLLHAGRRREGFA